VCNYMEVLNYVRSSTRMQDVRTKLRAFECSDASLDNVSSRAVKVICWNPVVEGRYIASFQDRLRSCMCRNVTEPDTIT
jgi:hypothetical protein